MKGNKINKNLLKNHVFSDNPQAWALEANGFFACANALDQSDIRQVGRGKFLSTMEAQKIAQTNKIICYLYSIAIELYLKALYSTNKSNIMKKTEKFSHNLVEIANSLFGMEILEKSDFDLEIIEFAEVLLWWHGRYFKPLENKLDEAILKIYSEDHDFPEMLVKKIEYSRETINKLMKIADSLSKITQINPSSIDLLLYPI